MRARTHRVVCAEKLLKMLILPALSLLSLPSIKACAIRVPGQRALAGARFRIPQTDRPVIAA
jgi:hypothetical protein